MQASLQQHKSRKTSALGCVSAGEGFGAAACRSCCTVRFRNRKGVTMKGVLSLKGTLESLTSLNSLESLEHGWILLVFPHSGA